MTAANSWRPRLRVVVLVGLALLALVFSLVLLLSNLLAQHYLRTCPLRPPVSRTVVLGGNSTMGGSQTSAVLFPTQSTLGFDKIFLINLDSRTDRLSQMLELTSFLHIKVDRLRANTSQEALDGNGNPSSHKACWSSHMRAYQEVVDNPAIHQALILEDDIDIDYDIHKLTPVAMDAVHWANPNWDMVYLGHCSGIERKYTVVDKAADIYPSFSPACTHGYAVSKQGAAKLLKFLQVFKDPIDVAIIDHIRNGNLQSYSRGRPLFSQYHSKADWSDVNADGGLGTTGDSPTTSGRDRLEAFYAAMV
ncbi:hypothetical protein H4R35_003226 [Dimargaris xerosporica]|nr:hypothetical protein H4R35_003226 [Dimargaris xerosporica]